MKNLNAIVWLYRGEVERYQKLLAQYRGTLHEYANIAQDNEIINAMHGGRDFAATVAELEAFLSEQRKVAKKHIEEAVRKDKKSVQANWDAKLTWIEEIIGVAKEANWLYEKFGSANLTQVPWL